MTARHQVGTTMLSALAVLIGTWLGHLLRFADARSAIVFPPYAVLTTALMLTPPGRWWIYVLASFVGHMLEITGASAAVARYAASTEVANATRALVAAGVWRALRREYPKLDTLESTAMFLAVAGMLAPAAGACVGAAVTVWNGRASPEAYWGIWTAWFLANAVVGVTLLPLLLVAVPNARRWRHRLSAARFAEISLLSVGLIAVSCFALTGESRPTVGLPMRLYAPLPFLLWAATRFGPGTTSASLLVVAAVAIAGAVTGVGPHPDCGASFFLALPLYSEAMVARSNMREHGGLDQSRMAARGDPNSVLTTLMP